MATRSVSAGTVRIDTKGVVTPREVEAFRSSLEGLPRLLHEPVIEIRALIATYPQKSVDHQVKARASIDVRGDTVRAETRAATVREAIANLEERLRHGIEHRADRRRHDPHGRSPVPGSWRKGNRPTARPDYYDRAVDERELVRRKTFSTPESTLEEARWDMQLLDYDFFLYRDVDTGLDTAIERGADNEDDQVTRLDNAPSRTVDEAIALLNGSAAEYHFFRDVDTERGAIVYRRYDGHYGLLTPR